jgi:hypothetical protein
MWRFSFSDGQGSLNFFKTTFEVIEMKIIRLIVSLLCFSAVSSSFAANVTFYETADKVKFEQYTTGDAPLALLRLPYPGVSTFPLQNGTAGTCTHIDLPANSTTMANRFLSLYMFVKTNGSTYFVQYDSDTCQILSFGMEG